MTSPNPKVASWPITYLAPLARSLRDKWILTVMSFLAAVVPPVLLYFVPKRADGTLEPMVNVGLIAAALVLAISLAADKLADRLDKYEADQSAGDADELVRKVTRAAEESTQHSVNEINWLLETAHRVQFLRRSAARANQVDTLRRDLVKAAASLMGPGTRATYYTLLVDEAGNRSLVQPVHSLTRGRSDRPDRPWIEQENPSHPIWESLDRSDTEPQVVREGEDAGGLDWSRTHYRSFISIPVKARNLVFGLLSVNSSDAGAFGDSERGLILTAARILALIEVSELGADNALKQLDLSDPVVRLQQGENGDSDDNDSTAR